MSDAGLGRTYVGDKLQSAAARLSEYVLAGDAPYDVMMAALEAERAVEEWTVIRRADATRAAVPLSSHPWTSDAANAAAARRAAQAGSAGSNP